MKQGAFFFSLNIHVGLERGNTFAGEEWLRLECENFNRLRLRKNKANMEKRKWLIY
jgi:hypothetical protein